MIKRIVLALLSTISLSSCSGTKPVAPAPVIGDARMEQVSATANEGGAVRWIIFWRDRQTGACYMMWSGSSLVVMERPKSDCVKPTDQ